jgi:DNA-binding CsgD family transcriptional regulator
VALNLASLGLTAEQERVYRYFLRVPHADLDAAAEELGVHHLSAVVDRLKTLGIIDVSLASVSPAKAVDLLIRRRVEQTSRELNQLSAAWDIVRDLTEEQRSGRPVELVERIEGVENVNRRIREFSSAKEVMNIANVVRAMSPDDEKVRRFRKRLSAGLVSRTLVSEKALSVPGWLESAREGHALGDLCRVSPEWSRQVLIISRSVAFVQIDPADRTVGALLIRQPGTVAILVDMFEGMWARARELNEPELTPIEQQVLQSLALHDKDETAARALNISVRKFRTHVAELMERLGAGNRFQAALLAKERGWL